MLRLGWRLVLAMLQWMGLFSWWIYSILVIFYFLGSNDFTMLVLLEFWWAIHSFSGELFNRSFVNFVCSFLSTSWFQLERKYLCCWTISNELIHTANGSCTQIRFYFGLIVKLVRNIVIVPSLEHGLKSSWITLGCMYRHWWMWNSYF